LRIVITAAPSDQQALNEIVGQLRNQRITPTVLSDEKHSRWKEILSQSDLMLYVVSQQSWTKSQEPLPELALPQRIIEGFPSGYLPAVALRLDTSALPSDWQAVQQIDYANQRGFERLMRAVWARSG